MKLLLNRVRVNDPHDRALINELRLVRRKAPQQLPAFIRLLRGRLKVYRAICRSLMRSRNAIPEFKGMIQVLFSDIYYALEGYPPRFSDSTIEMISKTVMPPHEAKLVKRLLEAHRLIVSSVLHFAHEPVGPRRLEVQYKNHAVFHFKNRVIRRPFRISLSGRLTTASGTYRIKPTPSMRNALRIQAAACGGESISLPHEAYPDPEKPMLSLEDHLVAAYGVANLLTPPEALRALGMRRWQGPREANRLRKRTQAPLERVLIGLAREATAALLKDPAPNLEFRAITAWADIAGLSLIEAAAVLQISTGTTSAWRAADRRASRLHRLSQLLSDESVQSAVDAWQLRAKMALKSASTSGNRGASTSAGT